MGSYELLTWQGKKTVYGPERLKILSWDLALRRYSVIYFCTSQPIISKVPRFLKSGKLVSLRRWLLVLLDINEQDFSNTVPSVLSNFRTCLDPLQKTHELPEQGSLIFSDLRLFLLPCHICWLYEPTGKTTLLIYGSAHSKLVKRGIWNLCFKNSIFKSCPHAVQVSFAAQVSRIKRVGYPSHL